MNMPTRLHLAVVAIGVALMAIPQNSHAQMRGFGIHSNGFAPSGQLRGAPWHAHPRRGIYLGDPLWYSDYYPSDQPYGLESAPPQVILLQPQTDPEPPQPRSQPLMIELQGDHYVRTGGYDAATATQSVTTSSTIQTVAAAEATVHLPTVLVYRDGHHEDVSGYAIIRDVIYARGNYYQDGYWTKNIELSSLNIPATLKANQENGVKFILPSSPNEVVTRP